MVYSTPQLIDDQFQLDEASQSSLGQACSLAFFANFDKKQGGISSCLHFSGVRETLVAKEVICEPHMDFIT